MTGPDGLTVAAVDTSGSYGVWARSRRVDAPAVLLVSRRGAVVALAAGVGDLSEIVDLGELRTAESPHPP